MFRHTLSRRDAFLLLLGASSMHIWSILFRETPTDHAIVIDTGTDQPYTYHDHHGTEDVFAKILPAVTKTATVTKTVIQTALPSVISEDQQGTEEGSLPHTSIIAHAPGWTLFRNLYMSNGTLYILTTHPRKFPKRRLMMSTGLPASSEPGNMEAREPTDLDMDFIYPDDAMDRWGGDKRRGEKNKVLTVEGNTLLFNDPSQFLRHYYHLVAELFFGVQAFWHGAFSEEEYTTPQHTAQELAFSTSLHPAPPHIDRAIFAHSNADGWRDGPGFNSYFLRAAYPSLSVEHEEDWDDRIMSTRNGDHAWRFPVVLLTDRSAAHRGRACGSMTQRTASEAWEGMRKLGKLRGRHVGAWWEPVRRAIWDFAGVPQEDKKIPEIHVPAQEIFIRGLGEGNDEILNGVGIEAQKYLDMPDKIVITYISRQGTSRRKLIPEDHEILVEELEALVDKKNEEALYDRSKKQWELNVVQAEKMTKDEQVRVAAKTTIMLGVHGNGLTHLVWMKPTKVSTVIEMFYPEGFAHDYQWTSRALGMSHFAVWNDTYHTHPDKPRVNYPDPGFQGNEIPIYGPAVAKIIEDRVEGIL